ncbi:21646_t:CDS:2 [Cetraspora pellucida]|uniref:21646_t:CDS:1 n=1 Tax=Cetraspora pellucida TaxID=1433469 RepID=A0A9N9CX30_9GLOM|nr:21646_t:CDS:2 [Cetraspora pellucida]
MAYRKISGFVPTFEPDLPSKPVIKKVEITNNDLVKDMHKQLEDLHINQTKIAKAIKKISSKPKFSCHKTKSKFRTKKKKLSKYINAYIILNKLSSDSSDSKNKLDFSETSEFSNLESELEKYKVNVIKKKQLFLIARDQKSTKVLDQKISSKKSILERSQSEAEISWPNLIKINFIHKIISNDVATICCKISSSLEKIIQVPSIMINSEANCLVILKGLIKLLETEVNKNKKPSVK